MKRGGLDFLKGLEILEILEVRDNGLIAGRALVDLYERLGAERQIDINARAELDESQVLVDITLFALCCIRDYPTCHGACHLTHKNLFTLRSLDDNG